MENNTIVITSEDEEFVVSDPESNKSFNFDWKKLAREHCNLQGDFSCVVALLEAVGVSHDGRAISVSANARDLILWTVEASRLS